MIKSLHILVFSSNLRFEYDYESIKRHFLCYVFMYDTFVSFTYANILSDCFVFFLRLLYTHYVPEFTCHWESDGET